MESSQNQIVSKKKTFWRMIKTIFIPAQAVGKLMVGCGSGRRKGKRRLHLSKMKDTKNSHVNHSLDGPPLNRPVCLRHPTSSINNFQIQDNLRENLNSSDFHDYPQNRIISTLPVPTAPTLSTTENSDSDSCILTLSTTPPNNQIEYSVQNLSSNEGLPAPLNLEEAEVYLESLTLQEHYDNGSQGQTQTEQLVTVEIENFNISRNLEDEDGSEIRNEVSGADEESDRRIRRNYAISSINLIHEDESNPEGEVNGRNEGVRMRRSRTSASLSTQSNRNHGEEFHGWKRSSIDVTSNPPVTLAFVPSGLCLGDRVVWVRDEQPEIGTVRWMGKIRNQFHAGIEFDKPVGNSSGIYGYGFGLYKRLFTCQLPYGRFVPVEELILYKDYHDTGVKSGIVCIICRDDFLDTWDIENFFLEGDTLDSSEGNESQAFNMVSTKCGHLYHDQCLNQWFSTKKKSEYHCPYCLKPMGRNEVIRIFPSQL